MPTKFLHLRPPDVLMHAQLHTWNVCAPLWLSPHPPSDLYRCSKCHLSLVQLPKAILLEGSPGVGKTSLVAALARAVGQNLVRVNLSEQTDMMDLLGADLPVDSGAAGTFAW